MARFRRWSRGRSKDRYVSGDYNVIDDLAGFKLKRSECVKRWDGLLIPAWSAEGRHPQELLRSVREDTGIEDGRPDTTPVQRTDITGDDL